MSPFAPTSLRSMERCDRSSARKPSSLSHASISLATNEKNVTQIIREESLRPFDLARGPIIRASLLRLGEHEHILLLCTHHIVSDAWSAGILFRELEA